MRVRIQHSSNIRRRATACGAIRPSDDAPEFLAIPPAAVRPAAMRSRCPKLRPPDHDRAARRGELAMLECHALGHPSAGGLVEAVVEVGVGGDVDVLGDTDGGVSE